MLLELCAIFLLVFWMWNRQKTARARKMIEKFPGPKALPILGNVRTIGGSTAEFFERATKSYNQYSQGGSPFRILIGSQAYVVVSDPKDFQIILGSQKHIEKGSEYTFLLPWLGTGLLTSSAEKWRCRRKILTPAFHFKILEGFLNVFKSNAEILVDKLKPHVHAPGFDISKYLTLYALDIICETAMGVKMNAQNDSESKYVQAIRNESAIIMQRVIGNPCLRPDFIFNQTNWKTIHEKSLEILHKTTENIIRSRRAAMEKELNDAQNAETAHADVVYGGKKRLAFLDILLEAALNGAEISDAEIREEVDTFMFEGHDTTSSAMSFTLLMLSWHQDIQNRVCSELKEIFPDLNDPITFQKVQELKYMERVIKETLRLYPSVPQYNRKMNEDVTLSGGLVIPAGTTVNLAVISSHTNPAFWPDPLKFDPDRFSPENIQERHPYAFVPFSAGPRNCIGQKFAMLEIKATLTKILRAYKILPGSKEPNLQLTNELVLTSVNGFPVKIENRKFSEMGKEND